MLQLGLGHADAVYCPVINPHFKAAGLAVVKVSCGADHTAFIAAPGRLFVVGRCVLGV